MELQRSRAKPPKYICTYMYIHSFSPWSNVSKKPLWFGRDGGVSYISNLSNRVTIHSRRRREKRNSPRSTKFSSPSSFQISSPQAPQKTPACLPLSSGFLSALLLSVSAYGSVSSTIFIFIFLRLRFPLPGFFCAFPGFARLCTICNNIIRYLSETPLWASMGGGEGGLGTRSITSMI